MPSVNSTVANTAFGKKLFVALKSGAVTYPVNSIEVLGTTASPGTQNQGVVVHDMGKDVTLASGVVYRLVKQILANQSGIAPFDTFYIATGTPTSDWVSLNL